MRSLDSATLRSALRRSAPFNSISLSVALSSALRFPIGVSDNKRFARSSSRTSRFFNTVSIRLLMFLTGSPAASRAVTNSRAESIFSSIDLMSESNFLIRPLATFRSALDSAVSVSFSILDIWF